MQAVPPQAPPVVDPPSPAPLLPMLPGTYLEQLIALGVVGLLVLLVVVWLVARARARARAAEAEAKAKAEVGKLPAEAPQLKVELPPSEAELARRREAEEARAKADALKAQRAELERQPQKDAEAGAAAKALKEQEEAAKKEEYRAKKAAEQEAKERKQREREEAERLRVEAEAKALAEEQARVAAEQEATRKKVEAEAGRTLAQGLDKTKQGFMARLNGLFGQKKVVDESVLAELEEILFTADIGVKTASKLVELAREKVKSKELADAEKMKDVIRGEIAKIVDLPANGSLKGGGPPHVVMVVGVNGAGKTTTIGKLASQLTGAGKKVVLAAGDTFRAAATEQLDVWADRARAQLVKGPEGGDPGAVVFDAMKKAKESGADVVIADTAGRLHTKVNLMEELKKVRRVMDKAQPGAPHEVLLVLDATNGQNAIAQAKQFHEAVGVSGIALTKLDGTAKGGVVIGICDELKLPVVWVGVGEKIQDLRRFEPKEFVSALFD
ncbi:MAG TPA: signal recognition particle-docking protein FtsY [Myxococcaceae bacterium]|nr:signal recognition particle-docking protein FtsY [Myxococcaceae bacterium]